jgi:hydroxyacylglutathione hydrolase
MIAKQVEVGRFAVFAYLVGCEKTGEALVIDPADECEAIVRQAEKNKLHIKYIVNTHGHVDHIMGNKRMKDLTKAQIVIHEKDAPFLTQQGSYQMSMFGAEPSPPADITVTDGDRIVVGEVSLQVIHTPGHSPGGICLYGEGVVFTGDTLFVGGIGRTDLDGGSWQILAASIQKKLFTLPEETIVLPGHNYGESKQSTIAKEKVYNPYVGQKAGY